MKIAFVSSFYVKHMEQIYDKFKDLHKKSFNEQNKIIRDQTICSMGEWPKYFQKIDVESLMLCLNNPYLQNKWCIENDFIPKSGDVEFEIVLEQLRRFEPTHIFIFGINYYSRENRLLRITDKCPSIRKKICWYGAPEGDISKLKDYDLVLTPSRELKDSLTKVGINSSVLNHAFEPRALDLIKSSNKNKNLCFIGSLSLGNDWHQERIEYLESISQHIKIDIYTDLTRPSLYQKLKRYLIYHRHKMSKFFNNYDVSIEKIRYYANKDNLPIYDRLNDSCISGMTKPAVYGLEMLNILSSYKITFNKHIPLANNIAGNMRITESSGVGTCLLSDHKKNNKDYFGEFVKYCSYKSADEFINKYEYLINNNDLICEISKYIKQITLSKHNTENQFDRLYNTICNL